MVSGRVAALIGNFDAKSKDAKAKAKDAKALAKGAKSKVKDAKSRAKGWAKAKVETKIDKFLAEREKENGGNEPDRRRHEKGKTPKSAGVVSGTQQPQLGTNKSNRIRRIDRPNGNGGISEVNPNVVPEVSPTVGVTPKVTLKESEDYKGTTASPNSTSSFKIPPAMAAVAKPTVTTATPPKEASSSKRGWGPPKAAPLLKSISAPCSPTPSSTSTCTMSPSPPHSRSPDRPSVTKVPGAPMASPNTPAKDNNTTTPASTTPPASSIPPKQKWGPPSATPYFGKSVSSAAAQSGGGARASPGSSPSTTPSINKPMPPSFLSRKFPAAAARAATAAGAAGGGKAGVVQQQQPSAGVTNPPASPVTTSSLPTAITASTAKSKNQATSTATRPKTTFATPKTGQQQKKPRPPPPSGPAPPVPPRSNIAVPATMVPSSVGCYNPLLPSKLVGGGGGCGGGGIASTARLVSGKVGATVGFSTSGPKLPSAPKPLIGAAVSVNTSAVFVDAQTAMLFKGKEIQVDYGYGGGSEESDNEGGEDHESDDEYHV